MAYRIDIGSSPLKAPRTLPDGRVVLDAIITRAGVFAYYENGKERRELRPPEEVFAPASIDSYALAPVTNEHPPSLLTIDTMSRYARGAVGPVRRDGDVVHGPISVFDADLLAAMRAGKHAVSAGYQIEIDETPGEHPVFGRYDVIQRDIRVNHVAIVDVGRAGPEARVRMDSITAPMGRQVPLRRHPRSVPIEMLTGHLIGAMRARDGRHE